MRKILLVAAAVGALSVAACSEGTEEVAGETVDSAMADTEANVDALGAEGVEAVEGVEGAAVEGADLVGGAAAEAEGAAAELEADVQDEPAAEAVVD